MRAGLANSTAFGSFLSRIETQLYGNYSGKEKGYCTGWAQLCTPREFLVMQWTNSIITLNPLNLTGLLPSPHLNLWRNEFLKFQDSNSQYFDKLSSENESIY